MKEKIVILGAGAVGGYVGAALAREDHDLLLVDDWAEHVAQVQKQGFQIEELSGECWSSRPQIVNTSGIHNALNGKSVDIAIVAVKSYKTAAITQLVAAHLSDKAYVMSLQNSINEGTIAKIVGWERTVGGIASAIGVNLSGPGAIKRNMKQGSADHVIFRVGEPDGKVTPRIERLFALMSEVDSSKITTNLMGERWTKLAINAMHNATAAVSGLTGKECFGNPVIRRFAIELGGETIRIAQALGYVLEPIAGLQPVQFVRAIEGSKEDLAAVDRALLPNPKNAGSQQRPSMGQDILKGRKTEVDDINGFVARKGKELGLAVTANATATEYIRKIEAGELQQAPDLCYRPFENEIPEDDTIGQRRKVDL